VKVADVFNERNNNIQPPNILRDEPQLLAKVPDLVQIERIEKDLKITQRELVFELGQTVIDVAGIIDPTPISDSISAVMSLSKRDYVGAALSMASIIPYIGDALGKPIKEVHNAQKIAQLEQKIEGLLKQLKELAHERLEKAAENAMEAVAKGRATLIEKIDKGHSLLRHGPDLTDNQLVRRLKEGIAPDGSIAAQVPRGSTRFNSHEDWLQIREKASEQITKRAPFHGGVDLTKPPPSDALGNPTIKKVERTIEFDRPIGDGFIGKEGTLHEITAQNGRELDVYGDVEKVEGLTRVKVTYEWNGKQWEAKQFFPETKNYDLVTHQYTTKPDIKTTLPPVVEKKASLDLGEKEFVAQQIPAVAEPTAKLVSYPELDSASPLSKIYPASQITQSLVDNDPQLKSAITAAVGYEKLIRAQGDDNTQFQDYRYTASVDTQTNKLTVSDKERGTLIEHIPHVSVSILQPLTEQDSQRFETMRLQLNRGQTIAQSSPPNAAQLHVENITPLSTTQLRALSPGELLKAVNTVQQWQKSEPELPPPAHQQKMIDNFDSLKNQVAQLKTEYQTNKQTYEQMDKRGVRSLLNPFGVSQNEYDCASRDCRVTRETLSLQRWEKAAVALGRPDSYVGKIQEIQSEYLEGKGVVPEAIEAMDKDIGQYQQRQQAWTQRQQAADRGFAIG
jgi:HPt (histidine-containing phosphotransfer) domain-containing protein/aspartate carbamoyltransferase regulatory subunit